MCGSCAQGWCRCHAPRHVQTHSSDGNPRSCDGSHVSGSRVSSAFLLDDVERASYQPLYQPVIGPTGIDADPVSGIAVVRRPYAVIFLQQRRNVLTPALHGNMADVVDVKIAEDVPADIKRQYVARCSKLPEGKLLYYLCRQRQA